METYKKLLNSLFYNYIIGSILAVFGVGGAFMYTSLKISSDNMKILGFIMILSFICMVCAEGAFFYKDLNPLRNVLKLGKRDVNSLVEAYHRSKSFPLFSVRRILIPHLLGMSVPAIICSIYYITSGKLELPFVYIVYATVAAIIVAILHAFIEFFLTIRTMKGITIYIKSLMPKNLVIEEKVFISIHRKFLLTVVSISVLPLVIILLSTRVKLIDNDNLTELPYWNWAIVILFITLVYSVLSARFLSRDIITPIYQLKNLMKKVGTSQFTQPNSAVYTDEFAELFKGFHKMNDSIIQRERVNKELLDSFMMVLSATLDARDPYTAGHSTRVAGYSKLIGENLKLSKEEMELLYKTAILHDIGKIGVPDNVLLKEGKLTEEEFAYIKAHPVIGENILKQVQPQEEMARIIEGVRSHHERYDGNGYPDGLQGEGIPYFGRILAVADAFDAMTSDRPYRKGMPFSKALSILHEGKETQWDGKMVEAFIGKMTEEKMEKEIS